MSKSNKLIALLCIASTTLMQGCRKICWCFYSSEDTPPAPGQDGSQGPDVPQVQVVEDPDGYLFANSTMATFFETNGNPKPTIKLSAVTEGQTFLGSYNGELGLYSKSGNQVQKIQDTLNLTLKDTLDNCALEINGENAVFILSDRVAFDPNTATVNLEQGSLSNGRKYDGTNTGLGSEDDLKAAAGKKAIYFDRDGNTHLCMWDQTLKKIFTARVQRSPSSSLGELFTALIPNKFIPVTVFGQETFGAFKGKNVKVMKVSMKDDRGNAVNKYFVLNKNRNIALFAAKEDEMELTQAFPVGGTLKDNPNAAPSQEPPLPPPHKSPPASPKSHPAQSPRGVPVGSNPIFGGKEQKTVTPEEYSRLTNEEKGKYEYIILTDPAQPVRGVPGGGSNPPTPPAKVSPASPKSPPAQPVRGVPEVVVPALFGSNSTPQGATGSLFAPPAEPKAGFGGLFGTGSPLPAGDNAGLRGPVRQVEGGAQEDDLHDPANGLPSVVGGAPRRQDPLFPPAPASPGERLLVRQRERSPEPALGEQPRRGGLFASSVRLQEGSLGTQPGGADQSWPSFRPVGAPVPRGVPGRSQEVLPRSEVPLRPLGSWGNGARDQSPPLPRDDTFTEIPGQIGPREPTTPRPRVPVSGDSGGFKARPPAAPKTSNYEAAAAPRIRQLRFQVPKVSKGSIFGPTTLPPSAIHQAPDPDGDSSTTTMSPVSPDRSSGIAAEQVELGPDGEPKQVRVVRRGIDDPFIESMKNNPYVTLIYEDGNPVQI